jgi:hypothetical protein
MMERTHTGSNGHVGDIPLACVPGAIPESQRAAHFSLIARLFSQRLKGKAPFANGYEYRFAEEDLVDLARFVENERRCCPFLSFSMQLVPVGGLLLRLDGPVRTREFLDAELPGWTGPRAPAGVERRSRNRVEHPRTRHSALRSDSRDGRI